MMKLIKQVTLHYKFYYHKTYILLDNLNVHCSNLVRKCLNYTGVNLLFTPGYSP